MKTARLIRTDNTERPLAPANGLFFTFEELYPLLDTDTIQLLYLPNGQLMLLDENGKVGPRGEKPRNDIATVIADHIAGTDYIVGDVVVCDDSQLR